MSFAKALNFTLQWEGGYVNDPKDPGGETKYGISKRAYPYLDIKNLDKEQAAEIYLRDYWNACNCDSYEPALAVSIFDAAVNVGVGRVQKWLREDFATDGLTVDEFNARREYYYRAEIKKSLRDRYLKGWLNRLNSLRKFIVVQRFVNT